MQYSGPGKVSLGCQGSTYALHGEGEMGMIKAEFQEKRSRRAFATLGYFKSTLDDQTAKITVTPFDCWALLPALLPPYLGVITGSTFTTGVPSTLVPPVVPLTIGSRPHDWFGGSTGAFSANALNTATVWTPDGRLYSYVRAAITRHVGLKLGNGMPLYTGMEISCLGDPAKLIGASAYLMPASYPVAGPNDGGTSAVADPYGSGTVPAYGVPDFVNGHWTGLWGASGSDGFSGSTSVPLDAEDGWDVMVDAKYAPLVVQKRTFHYILQGVEFMIKARLTGPSHTQLAAKILAHTLGGVLTESSATALSLSGPNSHGVYLPDCEVYMEGSGFEFGGTKLGTGETAFVAKIDVVSGVPNAGLVFST